MLQQESQINIADNTGAKIGKIIRVYGHGNQKYAKIGTVILITIKKASPRGLVKKSDKVKAVVVRQKRKFKRKDNSYIRFDDNACVIVEGFEPKGARIFGPIPREIKELGYKTIASLAEEIV